MHGSVLRLILGSLCPIGSRIDGSNYVLVRAPQSYVCLTVRIAGLLFAMMAPIWHIFSD